MYIQVEIVKHSYENENGKWGPDNVMRLLDLAKKCQGLSGRSLRKLPLLAHAWFVQNDSVALIEFLKALDNAVDKHMIDTKAINSKEEMNKINHFNF